MVLTPVSPTESATGETSWWMVAAMVVCLIAVVGLGFHLPRPLTDLLHNAAASIGGST
jgi:hypothetical protein